MAWKSMIPGQEIPNIKDDRKTSVGIEQYKVSAAAIYSKGEYLPVSAIKEIKMQQSTYTPACACGKGIPVYKLRIDYGMEKPMVLMIEKEKNAEKLLSVISETRPDIRIERQTP